MLFDRYNFSPTLNEQFGRRARLIVECHRDMDIDAANVADQDLAIGLEFIEKLEAEGFPYVSANLRDPEGNPTSIPAYRIVDVGGLKVGIFGLLTEKMRYKTSQRPEPGFTVIEPFAAAKETVDKLKQENVDIIVALANLGFETNKLLAAEVEGINFIISGHDARLLKVPERVGETLIFQALNRGMYLGVANIVMVPGDTHFVDAGEREAIRNEIVALNAQRRVYSGSIANVQEVKDRLGEISARLPALDAKAKQLLKPVSRVENNMIQLDAQIADNETVGKKVAEYKAREKEIIENMSNTTQ